MNLTVLFAVLFVAAVVAEIWWNNNRENKRKWLRTATVEDVVQHPLYEANMRIVIDELKGNEYPNGHPYHELSQEKVFNSKDMTELYMYSIQKKLVGYTKRERDFIREVGMAAFRRTIEQLKVQCDM